MWSARLSIQNSSYGERRHSNVYREIRDHVAPMWDIVVTLHLKDGDSMMSNNDVLSYEVV